jgi:glycerophosphoryl diester phosphodiesterase
VLWLARVISASCVLLLGAGVLFDTQVERLTVGTVPAQSAAQVRGHLDVARAPLLVVAHNAGDDLVTATDAVAYGAGAVEVDVRTIDGELYASHDQPLPFLEEIAFRGPELERAWRVAALRDTVLLHYKDHSDAFERRVAGYLAARPPRHLVIQASREATLESVKRRILGAERLLLVFDAPELAQLRADPGLGTAVDGLNVRDSLVTPDVERWARSHGLRLFVWTVNDARRLDQLIRGGIDGVITERLDLMHLLAREGT